MIDPKTQAELRARFNPEGSKLRIYQERLFEILCYIDDVCNANNIKYWLSSGTCLGAVRHGGFIPWDDDIDIEMMEDDYQKFCTVMKNQNNDKYVFQTLENDPGYIYPFGKVRDLNSEISEMHGYDKLYKYRGCYVDVFHLIPSNSLFLFKTANWLIWKEMMLKQKCILNKNRQSVLYNAVKCFNKRAIPFIKNCTKICASNRMRHSYGCWSPVIRKCDEVFPLNYAFFENRYFPIPSNYDSYLRRMFGCYNSLPDLNNIHVHLADYKFY